LWLKFFFAELHPRPDLLRIGDCKPFERPSHAVPLLGLALANH